MREKIIANLTNILGRGPGTVTITPLPQDASMRRYYRLSGPELGGKKIIGETIILMVLADPNPKAKSEEITANNGGDIIFSPSRETDLDFVNVLRHLEAIGAPVPKLYHYDIENGLLFLEDLGDLLLEDAVKKMNNDQKRTAYKRAIDLMFIIHEDGTARENKEFVGFKRCFDEKLLFYELMHYVEYGIEARKKVKVRNSEMKVLEKHMKLISSEIAQEPRVLAHRDFQSRNLMVQGEKLRVIDFQDALMGTRQYDLVSLLRDSYVVLDNILIDELIDYYLDKLENKTGNKIDRAYFRRVFYLQTLQRKIKDAGRFDYIDIVKKNPRFLKYIPDTLAYVKDAFEKLPEHAPMQEILAKYTPELK